MSKNALVFLLKSLRIMDGPKLDKIAQLHYVRALAEFTDDVIMHLIDCLDIQFERRPSPAKCRKICVEYIQPLPKLPDVTEVLREIANGISNPKIARDANGFLQYYMPDFTPFAKQIIDDLGGYSRINDPFVFTQRDLRFSIEKAYKTRAEEHEKNIQQTLARPAITVDQAQKLLEAATPAIEADAPTIIIETQTDGRD